MRSALPHLSLLSLKLLIIVQCYQGIRISAIQIASTFKAYESGLVSPFECNSEKKALQQAILPGRL